MAATTYIYVIRDVSLSPSTRATVKVGRSRRPRKRLGDLQSGNPRELRLVRALPGEERHEAEIHQLLRRRHLSGEWFTIPVGWLPATDDIDAWLRRLRNATRRKVVVYCGGCGWYGRRLEAVATERPCRRCGVRPDLLVDSAGQLLVA